MKQRVSYVLLLACVFCGIWALADTPEWIQSEERLVGENSTQYEDTLNRAGKTIWTNFLMEHDSSGFHNYSALAANMDIDVSSKLDVSVFQNEHNADGSHTFTIPSTTDDLTEGTNLFYTDTRVSTNSSVTANTTHRQTTGNPHSTTPADIGAIADSLFLVEHNADGTHTMQTGGVTYWGIESTSHSNTLLSVSQETFTQFEQAELQLSVLAEVTDLAIEEVFVEVETTYSAYTCPKIRFGKTSTNYLFVEHCTNVMTAAYTRYTSTIPLTAAQQGRMVEYAVKVDEGTGITFYMDGVADTLSISTTMDKSGSGTDVLRLYKGFSGVAGPVKIGNAAVWPDGWKGISRGGESFPFAVFLLPLSEGEGSSLSDAVGGLALTLNAGAWVEIPGPY